MNSAGSDLISIGVHFDLPDATGESADHDEPGDSDDPDDLGSSGDSDLPGDSASYLPRPDLSTADVDRLARQVLAAEAVTAAEIDIVFCGDERITLLNREWLDSNRVTDVIAFPLSGDPIGSVIARDRTESPGEGEFAESPLEGEIYINTEQALRQAPEFESGETEEVVRLIVHGLLHLLGYTDIGTSAEAEAMKARQEEFVRGWQSTVPGGQV